MVHGNEHRHCSNKSKLTVVQKKIFMDTHGTNEVEISTEQDHNIYNYLV